LFVKNLYDVELVRGGPAATVSGIPQPRGHGRFNDSYVAEIPPGKSLKAHRHLFEETIYILKGQGATSVWIDPSRKETFEWQEGSYFSIPMNAWHEHHNASGLEAARYIAMTSAPRVIDTFNNYEFVFDNPFVFRDRYNAEEGYFKQKAPAQQWSTNFVADVRVCQTYSGGFDRGGGAKSTVFRMVNNTVKSHVSLWVSAHTRKRTVTARDSCLDYQRAWLLADVARQQTYGTKSIGGRKRVCAAGNVVSSAFQWQR